MKEQYIMPLLGIVFCLGCLSGLITFYYLMIQPAQDDKIKQRYPSKKEIDDVFNEVAPFFKEGTKAFCNN